MRKQARTPALSPRGRSTAVTNSPTAMFAMGVALLLVVFPLLLGSPLVSLAQDSTAVSAAPTDSTADQIPANSALRIMELQEKLKKDPYDGKAHTELGILYTKEKMYDEARNAFIAAIQCAPGEPLTHLNLAVALIKMKSWREAIQPLTAFSNLAPEDGRGYILLGDAYSHLDQMDKARANWESGLRMLGVKASDKAEMLRRLVQSYEDEDDMAGAVAEMNKHETLLVGGDFADLRARRVGLQMKLAKEAQDAGKDDEALKWMARARQSKSAPVTAWTAAAEILLAQQLSDSVETLATEYPNAPAGTCAYLRGRVAEYKEDLEAAARFYKEALAANSEYPGASAFLGGVLARLGDTRGAQKALAQATARGEGGVTAKYNQAVVRSKSGDYRGAIPLLEEVISKEPDLKDAYRALAAAYRKTDNFKKAADLSEKLVDKFGPTAGDLYQLAYAQAKIGRYADAAETYESVTAMAPNDFNAYYGRGQSLIKLERFEDAIESFTAAVKLRPDNEIAVFNLAFAYQKAGEYKEAIDTYLDATDLRETIRSYTNIAICYGKLGDKDAADEYYKKVNAMKKQ